MRFIEAFISSETNLSTGAKLCTLRCNERASQTRVAASILLINSRAARGNPSRGPQAHQQQSEPTSKQASKQAPC